MKYNQIHAGVTTEPISDFSRIWYWFADSSFSRENFGWTGCSSGTLDLQASLENRAGFPLCIKMVSINSEGLERNSKK